MERTENTPALESSLLDLHASVARLIRVIQDNASVMDRKEEILDKLPLLDFYNDDLLRNIRGLKDR